MSIGMVPSDHPVLHQVADPVPPSYFTDAGDQAKLVSIVGQMRVLLREQNGVGLAAPQLGLPVRLFIIDYGGRRYTCINPEIIKWSGNTMEGEEGCLSFPGQTVIIPRDTRIKVSYIDEIGETKKHYMTDWVARIFQHEFDHLNGVTIQDHAES